MAISTDTNKAQYNCNGSITEFDLSVRILDEDDVQVFLKNTTTGTQTQLAKTTEYTIAAISGDYDNGARVTTVATYSSIYQITLIREVDLTQDLDLEEGGDLPSNGLEDALDKGVMQAQQISEQIARSITAPVSDSSSVTYLLDTAQDRASKALGFTTNGSVTSIDIEAGTVAASNSEGIEILNTSSTADDVTIGLNASDEWEVKDGGVDTAQLADGCITSDKLTLDCVNAGAIQDNAVVTTRINDGAVTNAKLGSDVGVWQSWTPVVTQGVSVDLTVSYAKYTKIGNTIHANFRAVLPALGTTGVAGNEIVLSGLPAAASAVAISGSGRIENATQGYTASIQGSSTTAVKFYGDKNESIPFDALGKSAPTLNHLDIIHLSVTYEAA